MTDNPDVDAEVLAVLEEGMERGMARDYWPAPTAAARSAARGILAALKSHPDLMRRFIGMEQVWVNGSFPGVHQHDRPDLWVEAHVNCEPVYRQVTTKTGEADE